MEATHNNKFANEGVVQQVKGNAEQAWGSVNEAMTDTSAATRGRANQSSQRGENEREHKAHDIRVSVASTAQNVKNHIQDSAADYRAKHDK